MLAGLSVFFFEKEYFPDVVERGKKTRRFFHGLPKIAFGREVILFFAVDGPNEIQDEWIVWKFLLQGLQLGEGFIIFLRIKISQHSFNGCFGRIFGQRGGDLSPCGRERQSK